MLLAAREPKMAGDVDAETTIDGPVTVAADARVRASRLVGPVVIGPDVSLEEGCTVVGSAIRDSILMAGCTVTDVEGLEASILGRNVDVRHSGGEHVHRLVVGDQSHVEVD